MNAIGMGQSKIHYISNMTCNLQHFICVIIQGDSERMSFLKWPQRDQKWHKSFIKPLAQDDNVGTFIKMPGLLTRVNFCHKRDIQMGWKKYCISWSE